LTQFPQITFVHNTFNIRLNRVAAMSAGQTFLTTTLQTLKCEHSRHTISYVLRHFLAAIIRESFYQLK
jgi:hypothetical protein